VYLIKTKRIFL